MWRCHGSRKKMNERESEARFGREGRNLIQEGMCRDKTTPWSFISFMYSITLWKDGFPGSIFSVPLNLKSRVWNRCTRVRGRKSRQTKEQASRASLSSRRQSMTASIISGSIKSVICNLG